MASGTPGVRCFGPADRLDLAGCALFRWRTGRPAAEHHAVGRREQHRQDGRFWAAIVRCTGCSLCAASAMDRRTSTKTLSPWDLSATSCELDVAPRGESTSSSSASISERKRRHSPHRLYSRLTATFREEGSQPIVSSLHFQLSDGLFLELERCEKGTIFRIPGHGMQQVDIPFNRAALLLPSGTDFDEGLLPPAHTSEPSNHFQAPPEHMQFRRRRCEQAALPSTATSAGVNSHRATALEAQAYLRSSAGVLFARGGACPDADDAVGSHGEHPMEARCTTISSSSGAIRGCSQT